MTVYNTEQCYEASHVYLPAGIVYDRSSVNFSTLLTEVTKEYFRMNLVPPEKNKIWAFLKHYLASTFIIDRMNVVSKPVLTIDILDFEKIYRLSTSAQSLVGKSMEGNDGDLIHYDSTLDLNHMKFSYSLTIPRPSTLSESAVKRRTNSTAVGEVIGVVEHKGDEILGLIVLHFLRANAVFSSLQSQIRQAKSRRRLQQSDGGGADDDKFGDDELLLKSLSFLHISDFLLLQATCKRWRNLLSYGLKLFSRLAFTSRFEPVVGELLPYKALGAPVEMVEGEEREPTAGVDGEELSVEAILLPEDGNDDDGGDGGEDNAVAEEGVAVVEGERLDTAPGPQLPGLLPASAASELPPLRLSFVAPATVAKLVQLTMRNICELRLDRVVLDRASMDNLYYLSGRLQSLSLGLVKVILLLPPLMVLVLHGQMGRNVWAGGGGAQVACSHCPGRVRSGPSGSSAVGGAISGAGRGQTPLPERRGPEVHPDVLRQRVARPGAGRGRGRPANGRVRIHAAAGVAADGRAGLLQGRRLLRHSLAGRRECGRAGRRPQRHR